MIVPRPTIGEMKLSKSASEDDSGANEGNGVDGNHDSVIGKDKKGHFLCSFLGIVDILPVGIGNPTLFRFFFVKSLPGNSLTTEKVAV
jgi:hypothetical protein